MSDVVNAVSILGKRDIIDYIAIFSPIVLSVIAACIAICTSKKQNRIALFDKRFVSITDISLLIKRWNYFANSILEYNTKDLGLHIYYMSLTMLSLYSDNSAERYSKVESYFHDNLENQIRITDDIESTVSKDLITLQNACLLFSSSKYAIDRFYLSYSEFTKLVISVHKGESDMEGLKHKSVEFLSELKGFESLKNRKLLQKIKI